MKKIGILDNGDLLVSMSPDEFSHMDKTSDEIDTARARWKNTIASKVINNFKDVHGKHYSFLSLKRMYLTGEFDGTLDSLKKVASGEILVEDIGEIRRKRLQEVINTYNQSSA